jgi:hypothetical protein
MDVHLRPLSELDRRTTAAWADLAARAIEPNPDFDPLFVLPQARHSELHAPKHACFPVLPSTGA